MEEEEEEEEEGYDEVGEGAHVESSASVVDQSLGSQQWEATQLSRCDNNDDDDAPCENSLTWYYRFKKI